MIFVTVGTQLNFDRLLRMVDAAISDLDVDVFFQVGPSDFSSNKGLCKQYLDSEEYSDIIRRSKLIIGHAGMGTIITSIDSGIPAILVPRIFSLGEHRNDHQSSTAKMFKGIPNIYIVTELNDMKQKIQFLMNNKESKDIVYDNSAIISFAKNLSFYIK